MEGDESGLLLKRGAKTVRWTSAGLRVASKDGEGYHLKIDGLNEDGNTEQVYVMLTENDVVDVIVGWLKIVQDSGGDHAKWRLKNEMPGRKE